MVKSQITGDRGQKGKEGRSTKLEVVCDLWLRSPLFPVQFNNYSIVLFFFFVSFAFFLLASLAVKKKPRKIAILKRGFIQINHIVLKQIQIPPRSIGAKHQPTREIRFNSCFLRYYRKLRS